MNHQTKSELTTLVQYTIELNDILIRNQGFAYKFIKIDIEKVIGSKIFKQDQARDIIKQIYALDILERSHWACLTSAARSMRWIESVVSAIQQSNFLSFSASLRGFLEATSDCYDLFYNLPSTLIDYGPYFNYILNREHLSDLNAEVNFSKIEELLLHFQFAERQSSKKSSKGSKSNLDIKSNTEYIKNFEKNSTSSGVLNLYAELCQITHPAAPSLSCFYNELDSTIELDFKKDKFLIEKIMQTHWATINDLLIFSLTPIKITLMALHDISELFPIIEGSVVNIENDIAKKLAEMKLKIKLMANENFDKKDDELLKFLSVMR